MAYVRLRGNLMSVNSDDPDNIFANSPIDHQVSDDLTETSAVTPELIGNPGAIKLIPWEDIWTSLRVAKIRGNGEMIEVFYDTLFKEAIFDDQGAWALNISK